MVTAATRRDARERAIELLYEAETKGIDVDEIVAALPLRPDAYALELATGVLDHRLELDHLLGRHARNWPVARMAVMDRIVLRLGAFELATKPEIPTGAALSEAVELGAQYGSTDDTSRFVNGVLVAVGDEVRGSRPWTPVDAVVFDMDGVFRHWDGEHHTDAEERLGLPPGAIAAVAFSSPDYDRAMRGELTVEEWSAAIGAAATAGTEVSPDDVAQVWLESAWTLDEETVALARGLRDAGTRIALLSNASTKLEADIEEMMLSDLFEVVGNSSQLHACKPEREIFDLLQARLDVDPGRILFVDDRDENVVGALEAGWHAVQWRSAERFGGVLRRLAVDGAPAGA